MKTSKSPINNTAGFFLVLFFLALGTSIPSLICNTIEDVEPVSSTVSPINTEHIALVLEYQKSLSDLSRQNDSLKKAVILTVRELEVERTKSSTILHRLQAELKKDLPAPCDTLEILAEQFVEQTATTDSLCKLGLENYQRLLIVKDSMILVCHERVENTDSLLMESVLQSQQLQRDLISCENKLQKSRRRTGILGASLAAVAALLIIGR